MGAVLSTMLLIGAMQNCASGYDDENDSNVKSVTIDYYKLSRPEVEVELEEGAVVQRTKLAKAELVPDVKIFEDEETVGVLVPPEIAMLFIINVETKDGTSYNGDIEILIDKDGIGTISAEGRETMYSLKMTDPQEYSGHTIYAKAGNVKSKGLSIE